MGALVAVDRTAITGHALMAWAVVVPLAYEGCRMGARRCPVANTAVGRGSRPSSTLDEASTTSPTSRHILIGPACLGFGAYPPNMVGGGRSDTESSLAPFRPPDPANAAYVIVMGGDYIHGRLLVAPLLGAVRPGRRGPRGAPSRPRCSSSPGTAVRLHHAFDRRRPSPQTYLQVPVRRQRLAELLVGLGGRASGTLRRSTALGPSSASRRLRCPPPHHPDPALRWWPPPRWARPLPPAEPASRSSTCSPGRIRSPPTSSTGPP